ncbi:MAG: lipoyl synthase [Halothiobacillaceae bacterium]|jgi:lipoic acid synthetase|nr:lipoyl synthase [Halothiobacillaceae bacterium]MDY0049726.1 lipoyl synthase [Halothiobacillaceae bacterium]
MTESASSSPANAPATSVSPGREARGRDKVSRIPIKVEPTVNPARKPGWIRARPQGSPEVQRLKGVLREHRLHTVCEEANCPNLGECFGHGTATFMIMGAICTRRCPFCDVAHGRPDPLDTEEPANLARTVAAMRLKYVVITSVDRDDLRDGGAEHFAAVIRAVREAVPGIRVEALTPDFRGREAQAVKTLAADPPDVFNHNLETVPRLYRQARPGADYAGSLALLRDMKAARPAMPTKSGLMVGLGERFEEILDVMRDLRAHGVDMLTIGQYLQPSLHHLPVARYVTPEEFDEYTRLGLDMGFSDVASGPMVRSSYHADLSGTAVLEGSA